MSESGRASPLNGSQVQPADGTYRDQLIPAEPGPVLERLLADLHERYTLGFTPPVADGKIARISTSASANPV